MGAVTRAQISELQAQDDGDALWFDGVCADITNGASLDQAYANLIGTYDVSWGAVANWRDAPKFPERRQKWDAALAARAELRRERAAASVSKIAAKDHADDSIGVGDTLKAAGLLLGEGGGKGGGLSIGVGSGTGTVRISVEFVAAGGGRVIEAEEI